MKAEGGILAPSEPGIAWLKAAPGFPVEDLLRSFHRLQQRALELELENLELKTAQQQSTNQFAAIYDSAHAGYVEMDDQTKIKNINVRAASLLGHEPSELVGQKFLDFVAEEDGQQFREHLRKCGSA